MKPPAPGFAKRPAGRATQLQAKYPRPNPNKTAHSSKHHVHFSTAHDK